MDVVLKVTCALTFGINMIGARTGSEIYLVTMLNSLQIIIHLPMFHVLVPPNVNIFFKYLIPFVKFDILNLLSDFEDGIISPNGFLNLF